MGYLDIQVNGYGGVDFNQDDLSREDLRQACQKLRADGVDQILATVITDLPTHMEKRLAKIAEHHQADPFIKEVIAGIHIEGPFLNPLDGYRGAHPAAAICPADVPTMRRLLSAAHELTRLVTLAPEQDSSGQVIRFLRDQGIMVSAGHTDASMEELQKAIAAGLTMFTHLGNGCPSLLPRHDNIIQRAFFLREKLWLCFIADGVHIPLYVLRNYLDLAGFDRCLVTTDAMAAAGLGPGRYRLGSREVQVGEDLAAREPGGQHLVGSAINMPRVEANLVGPLGLTALQCKHLTDINPRRTGIFP